MHMNVRNRDNVPTLIQDFETGINHIASTIAEATGMHTTQHAQQKQQTVSAPPRKKVVYPLATEEFDQLDELERRLLEEDSQSRLKAKKDSEAAMKEAEKSFGQVGQRELQTAKRDTDELLRQARQAADREYGRQINAVDYDPLHDPPCPQRKETDKPVPGAVSAGPTRVPSPHQAPAGEVAEPAGLVWVEPCGIGDEGPPPKAVPEGEASRPEVWDLEADRDSDTAERADAGGTDRVEFIPQRKVSLGAGESTGAVLPGGSGYEGWHEAVPAAGDERAQQGLPEQERSQCEELLMTQKEMQEREGESDTLWLREGPVHVCTLTPRSREVAAAEGAERFGDCAACQAVEMCCRGVSD